MVKEARSEYLSSMVNIILLFLFCQTGDETVLATAERLFHSGNTETAAEMITSHEWSSDSLWSRAGLLRDLCTESFNVVLEPFQGESVYEYQGMVQVEIHAIFNPGDSLRLIVPVPAELPWQTFTDEPEITVSGIQGNHELCAGWLLIEGVPQGEVSAEFSVPVEASCMVFNGSEVAGTEDAMVFFPGEDPFMDTCLDEMVFWSGGDRIYLESVRLARAEPNPMRLLDRVRERIAGFSMGTDPVNQHILLVPAAELALEDNMDNSAGGVLLAAAILRRWQIPALAVPGRFNGGTSAAYVLFVHVKPFGWMVLSPVPGDFTAFGASEHPEIRSWPWGVPGLTVYAETRSSETLWHSVPSDSSGIEYTVRTTPL